MIFYDFLSFKNKPFFLFLLASPDENAFKGDAMFLYHTHSDPTFVVVPRHTYASAS